MGWRTTGAVASATALVVGLAAPADAGVAGPNGSLSEQTEFRHEVVEDVTTQQVGPPPGTDPATVTCETTSEPVDTTLSTAETFEVTVSDNAQILGVDPRVDPFGDFVVVEGSVVILRIVTTTETHHLLETTTCTGEPLPPDPPEPPEPPEPPAPPTPSPAVAASATAPAAPAAPVTAAPVTAG